ncbi:MAG: chromosome segregation ATPase [Cyanobacteria bacterium P01_A01_bin.116]
MASKYNDDYDASSDPSAPKRPVPQRPVPKPPIPKPSTSSGPSSSSGRPANGPVKSNDPFSEFSESFSGSSGGSFPAQYPTERHQTARLTPPLSGGNPPGAAKRNTAKRNTAKGNTAKRNTAKKSTAKPGPAKTTGSKKFGLGTLGRKLGPAASGRSQDRSRLQKGSGPYATYASAVDPNVANPLVDDREVGRRWFGSVPASLLGLRWLRSWPFIVLIIFGVLGTAGATAMVSLFRMPSIPNCRAIFWPTASASLRLQCAETYAAEGDVANLLSAIALVDKLPEDHPLRSDIIDDRIENWANQVLDLAERSFEEGEIDVAISTAKKIPQRTAAAKVVEERIARWQKIWQEGEDGFNVAVEKLKEKNFQQAFSLSVALLDVENTFWSTVKYNELTKLIASAREDSGTMSKALGFAKQGTVKGYTEALKRLKEIKEESVFYAEAQGKRKDIAQQMLERGEEFLAARQLSDAQALLNAIPRDTGLDRELADFQVFVTAYQQAWTNTSAGLENAINRMKTLGRDRPRYARGQQLIAQWQGELQNVALLNQARERASRGSTADLTAAIAVAGKVSRNTPQWDEATDEINGWRSQVETVQDRPILERADRLAAVGTPDNLRAAIQEARKVSSGRTLGQEADERIANWTERIQRIEDQPVLDQARARARAGDVPGAIAIARRIGEGRSLYSAAQEDIASWQANQDGRRLLAEAATASRRGDAAALVSAISTAQRVPSRSDSRASADTQIGQWSWALLRQAESVSNRNVETAISLAQKIPSGTEAYEPAQLRIQNWQATLQRIEESRRPAPSPLLEGGNGAPEVDENGVPPRLELRSPDN